MDFRGIRDDITSFHASARERFDMHTTQLSAIHHHHAEMMAIHDRKFISIETRLDDFETRLDRQDACFIQILDSQREMMDYLRSVFPPPAP